MVSCSSIGFVAMIGYEEQIFDTFPQGSKARILEIDFVIGKNLADAGNNAGLVRTVYLDGRIVSFG